MCLSFSQSWAWVIFGVRNDLDQEAGVFLFLDNIYHTLGYIPANKYDSVLVKGSKFLAVSCPSVDVINGVADYLLVKVGGWNFAICQGKLRDKHFAVTETWVWEILPGREIGTKGLFVKKIVEPEPAVDTSGIENRCLLCLSFTEKGAIQFKLEPWEN